MRRQYLEEQPINSLDAVLKIHSTLGHKPYNTYLLMQINTRTPQLKKINNKLTKFKIKERIVRASPEVRGQALQLYIQTTACGFL